MNRFPSFERTFPPIKAARTILIIGQSNFFIVDHLFYKNFARLTAFPWEQSDKTLAILGEARSVPISAVEGQFDQFLDSTTSVLTITDVLVDCFVNCCEYRLIQKYICKITNKSHFIYWILNFTCPWHIGSNLGDKFYLFVSHLQYFL